MFPATGMRMGARGSRSNYQITLWSTELRELIDWAPRVVQAVRKVPGIADVTLRPRAGRAAGLH